MKRLIPICGMTLLLAACGNSDELDRLRSDLNQQKLAAAESTQRRESDRDALKAEIAQLRARLGEIGKGDPSRPLSATINDLSERLAKVEQPGDGNEGARLAAVEKKLDEVEKEAVEAAKAEIASGAKPVTEERVRQIMAEKIAEQQVDANPTKKFTDAIGRLKISEAEKEALKQSIVDCKKAQLELLETPTPDGRVFAEELIDAFIKVQDNKATQADLTKLFIDITGTKVPGDAQGRTYLQIIEEAKKKNRDNIGKLLTPEDQAKLTRAHADWSEFELGEGDPWGALYMERMEKYQKAKEK